MIIEPTGWAIQCENCDVVLDDPYGRVDGESEMLAAARKAGWIAPIAGIEFCSLDCLLAARETEWGLEYFAHLVRDHMATHADRCCRLHRTHATRGRHHWADCPDPKRAGVAVL